MRAPDGRLQTPDLPVHAAPYERRPMIQPAEGGTFEPAPIIIASVYMIPDPIGFHHTVLIALKAMQAHRRCNGKSPEHRQCV